MPRVSGPDAPASLDGSLTDRLLRPLARVADDLTVHIEQPDGRMVGRPSSDRLSAPGPRLTRELLVDGRVIGRLVAEGTAVTQRPVAATLEALAIALEELATTSREASVGSAGVVAPDGRSGIAAELALSRLQQRSIVSLEAPEVAGYDLASYYEPAREIGGDFFELFRLRRQGRPLGLVIADVTGKGIAAALLMAFARPVIHSALQAASGPADALARTNRILVEELHTPLFITALVGRLDVKTGRVRSANAGHEPPLLVPADASKAIIPAEGGGPMLGMFVPLEVAEIEVELTPGDRLVLYTDGVTDALTSSGERFGKARLIATIEGARDGSAHDIVAAIRDAVTGFCEGVVPVDDVTIVAVGRHRVG
jgi:Stage II sporulation protein E (SpoIIE)